MTTHSTATSATRLTVPAIDPETDTELTAVVPRLDENGQLDLEHTPHKLLRIIEALLDRVEALEERRPRRDHNY